MTDWCDAFYDDLYADLALVGHPEQAGPMAARMAKLLRLTPSSRVFDQCCGVGRWALELAALGHTIEGVDIIPSYIERARHGALERGVDERCTFTCADARSHLPAQPCDAAINWHTSFGYSPHDADNMAMLHRAYEALRPGGRLGLEVGHAAQLLADFQPVLRSVYAWGAQQVQVTRESTYAEATRMLTQRWTLTLPDGQRLERRSWLKLYQPHELLTMAREVGFKDARCWADVDASPLLTKSPRCVLTAQRPA